MYSRRRWGVPLVATLCFSLLTNLTVVSVASAGDTDFRRWLANFDAEMLFASFKEEGFTDLQEVVDARLTETDLKELGIKKMKTRKAVFHALSQLADGTGAEGAGVPAPAPAPAPAPVNSLTAPVASRATEPTIPVVASASANAAGTGIHTSAPPLATLSSPKMYSNGDRYTGEFKHGKRHGRGKLVSASGAVYDGEWGNDKRHGRGVYATVNGARYEGWYRDDRKNGRGLMTFTNGASYSGNFQEDKKHGKGTFRWPDGEQYTGDWHTGKLHGRGSYVWADGAKYEGQWKNDNRHGFGVYTGANGDHYVGQWMNDVKHGIGKSMSATGDKYDGEWMDGKSHGRGAETYADGRRYEGEFRYGFRHGHGAFYSADKTEKYSGAFKNGVYHGKGVYVWKGGRFEGDFMDNKRHGRGIEVYGGGQRYDGEWRNDKYEGRGAMWSSNGERFAGKWLDHKPVHFYVTSPSVGCGEPNGPNECKVLCSDASTPDDIVEIKVYLIGLLEDSVAKINAGESMSPLFDEELSRCERKAKGMFSNNVMVLHVVHDLFLMGDKKLKRVRNEQKRKVCCPDGSKPDFNQPRACHEGTAAAKHCAGALASSTVRSQGGKAGGKAVRTPQELAEDSPRASVGASGEVLAIDEETTCNDTARRTETDL